MRPSSYNSCFFGGLALTARGNRYIHVAALGKLAPDLHERLQSAAVRAGLSADTEFNVIKIDEAGKQISLLYYEHFFESPFPALRSSVIVNLPSGRVKRLRYDLSDNPPILHRKELLLPPDHPQTPLFAALTEHLEAAGLLRDTRRIGLVRQWQERLAAAGDEVRDQPTRGIERCCAAEVFLLRKETIL